MTLDEMLPRLDPYLEAIEQQEDITIAAAWLMGSHAHGIADAASDYDIRFIYIQSPLDYASLTRQTDSLSFNDAGSEPRLPDADKLDADIELAGWDAKRFLELLTESNPSTIECLESPHTIRSSEALDGLREYIETRFNIIDLHNHYQSLATRNYRKYIADRDQPTAKRMLYIMRGCLYAGHLRETHEFPPLDLPTFIEATPEAALGEFDRDACRDLIEMKQAGRGDEYIDIERFEPAIESAINYEPDYEQHIRDDTINAADLDAYMRSLLRDV